MSRVGKGGRYPDEVRERAVRMVFEHQHEYPSQWKASESIGEKLRRLVAERRIPYLKWATCSASTRSSSTPGSTGARRG